MVLNQQLPSGVYTLKKDENGNILKHKARLVTRDFYTKKRVLTMT